MSRPACSLKHEANKSSPNFINHNLPAPDFISLSQKCECMKNARLGKGISGPPTICDFLRQKENMSVSLRSSACLVSTFFFSPIVICSSSCKYQQVGNTMHSDLGNRFSPSHPPGSSHSHQMPIQSIEASTSPIINWLTKPAQRKGRMRVKKASLPLCWALKKNDPDTGAPL